MSAKSAVVISAADGRVLYEKNSREKLPIASTTKIMTALLTLEAASRNDRTVLITPEMIRVEGSSMGLKAGDKLTLTALAEGMLSVSGNDAANSAAIAVGGSTERFAALMNQKAAQLGLSETHYVTPSGLDNAEHYSSAGDLAKLTAAALKNPEFARIVSQKKIQVRFSDPDRTVTYTNHNKLLSMYAGCNGVKTGFTKKSGRCLVSAAQRDGVQLVAVTLSDPNDWEDHEKLLDYGFSRLTCFQADDSEFRLNLPVVGGTAGSVSVLGTAGAAALLPPDEVQNLRRTVELPQFLYAPVKRGQVLGLVRYQNETGTVSTTKLLAGGNVSRQAVKKNIFEKLWDRIRVLFSV
ncbi:D-alanyl-D-alanine carboxypeptidase family protein [Caproicibacter fermentans]|uniref:serine-type D-Ala-D-Ala carboxypeptidase n=1 Tax=Caproicibacter fermentans TaxID=2576756 RepID=A0A7G8TCL9_9FIRM|nr:D-alanyl-D-alanine carboxypeptidase family protein [Caproicibacter fermentans]QNK41360.1 D-alanyl-D-alanine carboxypeptidase [Caproicibacter fermentans]